MHKVNRFVGTPFAGHTGYSTEKSAADDLSFQGDAGWGVQHKEPKWIMIQDASGRWERVLRSKS